jgi:hypothetical protein
VHPPALLARGLRKLTELSSRERTYRATCPDLTINTGDVVFDAPINRDDLAFAKTLHDALPVACRNLPGNCDVGGSARTAGASKLRDSGVSD